MRLRQHGSQAVGPGSGLFSAKYFYEFTEFWQKFHSSGSHGLVERTTWFWSGRYRFEFLSCQVILWFRWHLSEISMVSMAQWLGQQGFEAICSGSNLSFYLHFLFWIIRGIIVISPPPLLCMKNFDTRIFSIPRRVPLHKFPVLWDKTTSMENRDTHLLSYL